MRRIGRIAEERSALCLQAYLGMQINWPLRGPDLVERRKGEDIREAAFDDTSVRFCRYVVFTFADRRDSLFVPH